MELIIIIIINKSRQTEWYSIWNIESVWRIYFIIRHKQVFSRHISKVKPTVICIGWPLTIDSTRPIVDRTRADLERSLFPLNSLHQLQFITFRLYSTLLKRLKVHCIINFFILRNRIFHFYTRGLRGGGGEAFSLNNSTIKFEYHKINNSKHILSLFCTLGFSFSSLAQDIRVAGGNIEVS